MKDLKNFYRSLFSRTSSKSTSQQDDSSNNSASGHVPGMLTPSGTKKLSKGVNGFTAMASDPGHAPYYAYKNQSGKHMEVDGVATISRIPPPSSQTEQISTLTCAHHPQHGLPPQHAQTSSVMPPTQSAGTRKTCGGATTEYSSQEEVQGLVQVPAAMPVQTMTNSIHQQAQQQTQSAQQTKQASSSTSSGQQEYESVTIRVSDHCPPAMRRDKWNVSDFELRAQLYNGNISVVYHAVDRRSGITVALKGYKRNKLTAIERHQVSREIQLHTKLAHASIIGMYAAWKDRSFVYMVLEWAPGGDVYSYLRRNGGRLPEKGAVALIMEPFLSGLALIHAQGLIHRDIKPENILLNNQYQVKIADFGLSIDSSNELANTRLGTIDYLAPEILDCPVKQTPYDNKDNPRIGYTNKVDCWSCGVLAYELLVGQPPFASTTPYETLNLIRTKEVVYPIFLSLEAISFMKMLLVRDPKRRASITEALEHPWILKYSQRSRMLSSHLRPQKIRSLSQGALSQAVRSKTTAGVASTHDEDEDMEPVPNTNYTPMQTQQQDGSRNNSNSNKGSNSKVVVYPGGMYGAASGKIPTTRLAAVAQQQQQGPGEGSQDMLMALPGQTGTALPVAPTAGVAGQNPNSAAARSQKFFSLQTNGSGGGGGGVAVVNVAAHKAQLMMAGTQAGIAVGMSQQMNGSESGKLSGVGAGLIQGCAAAQASSPGDGPSTSRPDSPTSASRKGSVQLPPLGR